MYAKGNISVPAGCTVGGNMQSGGSISFSTGASSHVAGNVIATNSITTTTGINMSGGQSGTKTLGGSNVYMQTGIPYSAPVQTPPTFDPGATQASAQAATQATGSTLSGDYDYSWYNPITKAADPRTVTIGAPGSTLPSYISGSVNFSPPVTLNFNPVSGSPVAWCMSEETSISGSANPELQQPGNHLCQREGDHQRCHHYHRAWYNHCSGRYPQRAEREWTRL